MKLPKTFRPDKDLEDKIDKLLVKQDSSSGKVENLFSFCELFLKGVPNYKDLSEVCDFASGMIERVDFTKKDVEEFSKRLYEKEEYDKSGFFLSALINKVIEEKDTLILKGNYTLSGVGAKLAKGNLVIEGNLGYFSGLLMTGGTITVGGSTKDFTGMGMDGGIIKVEGVLGKGAGSFGEGGKIYQKGRKVYPH